MSSPSGQHQSPMRRSSRPRSASPLSPTSFEGHDSSPVKSSKTSKESDCKTVSSSESSTNDSKTSKTSSGDGNDSPAFRLRPRRSTPRPSESSSTPSPGKRFSLYAALMASNSKYLKSGDTSQVKRKLFFNKQKVYPPTLNCEDQIQTVRVVPQRSPLCSITEGIIVSPFVQKISPQELEPDRDYGANYVSLRIVFREEIQIDGERVLKVIAAQIEEDYCEIPSSSRSCVTPKTVVIYLHGSYATCRAEVNKVINIVKFKTQSVASQTLSPSKSHTRHTSDSTSLLPYAIVVKSCEDPNSLWVPFVSITNKWEPPKDPKELNKTLVMSSSDASTSKEKIKSDDEVNCKYN